ncbi:hypothetical protein IR010_14485 [Flavobacterium sp. MR2016-29]|uniref:hypothetical protein n=1 Tax=Flavobacterium sp. MR2016-29 TaxID=2783795 RepID=UPI001889E2AB|nr:hypothetical protein [Flavobacterium sp. MR2016-29]MBF4493752.1 hypothetical protein [Flavobacterium sp. MR2016-29]
MRNAETISWIVLALAIASQDSPVNFISISQIADGINHSIPNEKEMQSSLTWLNNNKLIVKTGKKYSLTEIGKEIFSETQSETKTLLRMWKRLATKIELKLQV